MNQTLTEAVVSLLESGDDEGCDGLVVVTAKAYGQLRTALAETPKKGSETMKRTALTDGSGSWFDEDAATRFEEDSRWNGNNHISVPTGSQWDHEALYYTASGSWVLNSWSQQQGSLETYEQYDESAAAAWMIQNNCADDDSFSGLPESVREAVGAKISEAEL